LVVLIREKAFTAKDAKDAKEVKGKRAMEK
jgi:hypothetical protein